MNTLKSVFTSLSSLLILSVSPPAQAANAPPVPVVYALPAQGCAPLTVKLDGRDSYDTDGSVREYFWSSTDGQTSANSVAEFTFTQIGTYMVTLRVVDNEGASASSSPQRIVVNYSAQTRLINLSTRAPIRGNGAYDIIAGFMIGGTGTLPVALRGWSLEYGVDPYLKLQSFPDGKTLATNNDWQQDYNASKLPEHMQMPKSSDAALYRELPVGAYTLTLSSVGSQGLGLVGVDALDATGEAKLVNLSTRAPIEGGANDIIAGFITSGECNLKLVIRSWALEEQVNPYIQLDKLGNEYLDSNDRWQDHANGKFIPEHMQLPNPEYAALLKNLPVGAYTATLSSFTASGLGLIGVDVVE